MTITAEQVRYAVAVAAIVTVVCLLLAVYYRWVEAQWIALGAQLPVLGEYAPKVLRSVIKFFSEHHPLWKKPPLRAILLITGWQQVAVALMLPEFLDPLLKPGNPTTRDTKNRDFAIMEREAYSRIRLRS